MRLLLFSLCFIGCHSLKKLQKEAVHIEKKVVAVRHKKDSLRSVFAEKKHVIIEDTGRIITYELSQPTTLKEIINGSALVHKVSIEEKKLNQKVTQKKAAQTTAIAQQKDSATAIIKENKRQEISLKKTPQTWSLWLWVVASSILALIVLVVFRKYIAIINPLKYIRR